ncbi:MAG: hypothetical protein M3P06_00305 [Acidobacteriota bacterium]|nr:hypothetical protein [Acidobacteriota bacterium]
MHRDDEAWTRGIRFELLADRRDPHVDGARERRLVMSPDAREQLVARDDRLAVLDQVPQHVQLELGKIDRDSCAPDFHPREIEVDVAEAVNAGFAGAAAGTAQQCIDACERQQRRLGFLIAGRGACSG